MRTKPSERVTEWANANIKWVGPLVTDLRSNDQQKRAKAAYKAAAMIESLVGELYVLDAKVQTNESQWNYDTIFKERQQPSDNDFLAYAEAHYSAGAEWVM